MTGDKKSVCLKLGLAAGALGLWRAWRRRGRAGQPFTRPGARAGTALITGGSSGIGAAFARRLAQEGYDLILVARRRERLEALAEELMERHGVEVEALAADLAQAEGMAQVVKRIEETDELTLLINNAGFGTKGRFFKTDIDEQIAMVDVHVTAPARLTHAALPGMLARRRGGIINLSSVAAFLPIPGNVSYCATKSYVKTFSQTLQLELAGSGVRLQALCPGFTRTEFHDRMGTGRPPFPGLAWLSPEEVVERSLTCLEREKVVCVVGFWYRLAVALAPWIPRSLVSRLFSGFAPKWSGSGSPRG